MNILSQYQIAVFSKWMISYLTEKFYELGNIRGLYYNVETKEGWIGKFELTPEELHVYTVNSDIDRNVFGKKIIVDGSRLRDMMCYYVLEDK